MSQMAEEEGYTHQGVASVVSRGIDDASIALTADNGVGVLHLLHYIHFTHCAGIVLHAVVAGHIPQSPGGTEVADGVAWCVTKDIVGNSHKGVFLTVHLSFLVNECQSIHIGVNNESYIVTTFGHETHDIAQVLLQRFGVVLEVTCRGIVERGDMAYTKLLEEHRQNDAAYGVDAVEGYLEIGFSDGIYINQLETQYHVDMLLVIGVVFLVRTQMIDVSIVEILGFGNAQHLVAFLGVEELSVAVEQLERVPVTGIVAGGDDDTTFSAFACNCYLGGGGGGDEPTSYTVTASSNNVSYGTASAGDSSLETGETTTITATPKSGYRFVSWAVSGTGSTLSSTTTNPTTLTMGSANTTVTATFEAIPTSLTPQSSKTWNFSEATWSSVSVATNSSTIVDDMELIATTQAIAMSSGSAISFPDGSSYSKYSSFKSNKTNQLHIKVAPYSKVTVYVKGGSGRTISVLEGSISGTSLMAEATSSSQSNPSCHYLGDVDGDLYITNSGGSNNLYIYAVKVEPLVHGTIGATGWTTFASSSKLDLSTISGGTAYFAASISENDVTLTSTSKIVEAGEGLMIKGTPDAVFAIETTTVAATFSDNNLLTGCITEANVGVNPDKYVLVNVGGEPKFQSLAEHGATIPAGKAYLDLTGGSPAPGLLRIVEGENNATAIEEFKANEDVVKFIENGRILILRDGITYDALGRIVK